LDFHIANPGVNHSSRDEAERLNGLDDLVSCPLDSLMICNNYGIVDHTKNPGSNSHQLFGRSDFTESSKKPEELDFELWRYRDSPGDLVHHELLVGVIVVPLQGTLLSFHLHGVDDAQGLLGVRFNLDEAEMYS
jgi:hypothetical protein